MAFARDDGVRGLVKYGEQGPDRRASRVAELISRLMSETAMSALPAASRFKASSGPPAAISMMRSSPSSLK